MNIYTTQGLMTAADMADMADLYDWSAGAQEEEAMEAAHAAHVDDCRACQEDNSHRETTARVALAMDTARRELEKGIRSWMAMGVDPKVRQTLEEALAKAQAALRSL